MQLQHDLALKMSAHSDQKYPNIVSVSHGDHLVFGENDGRLDTKEALWRRMNAWREELKCGRIHWRLHRAAKEGVFSFGRGVKRTMKQRALLTWNYLEDATKMAHELGMKIDLYDTIFDEGWPLPPKDERESCFHNAMHLKDCAWQSRFAEAKPKYLICDRSGKKHQWGVPCLAYEQVRKHFVQQFLSRIMKHDFDGFFLCLRSQSKPPSDADQFGFNEPIVKAYYKKYGVNIVKNDFCREAWRALLGDQLTIFLKQLKSELKKRKKSLGIGCPVGRVIGPPLGNMNLDWPRWIKEQLVDVLVINQNSRQCPSMWHTLWPMCKDRGYVQNYRNGFGLSPLSELVKHEYLPLIQTSQTKLYLATQWQVKELDKHVLISPPKGVAGYVFSSFRFDNPKAIKKGNWHA